jgi:uncharacterized membrane protein
VSFGTSDFLAGLATRQASVVKVAVTAQTVNAAMLSCVVPLVSARAPSLPSLALGAAAGLCGEAGAMALFLGFRHADFSVASAVSSVAAAAFSVLAAFLLGERPGALSLAGIALAVPAIAGMSARAGQTATRAADAGAVTAGPGQDSAAAARRRGPRATGRHAAGVAWSLIAGIGFGLFLVGLNRAGSATDLWPVLAAELTALVTVICTAAVTRQLGLPPTGIRPLCGLSGLIAAAGVVSYFLATHRGLLAVVAVVYALYPAATIALARVLLGERLTVVRIIGLILAGASVSLIAAAGGT